MKYVNILKFSTFCQIWEHFQIPDFLLKSENIFKSMNIFWNPRTLWNARIFSNSWTKFKFWLIFLLNHEYFLKNLLFWFVFKSRTIVFLIWDSWRFLKITKIKRQKRNEKIGAHYPAVGAARNSCMGRKGCTVVGFTLLTTRGIEEHLTNEYSLWEPCRSRIYWAECGTFSAAVTCRVLGAPLEFCLVFFPCTLF